MLDREHVPTVALQAFVEYPDYARAILEVIQVASRSEAKSQELNRATWALSLYTEVYRAGLLPGSPLLVLLNDDSFNAENLLSLAPQNALRQLDEMTCLAESQLLPCFSDPLYLGPVFKASQLCSADADIISGGLLLDLKTRLGTKNSRGLRYDSLSLEDLYQVLAYALFNHSDSYEIDSIGIYSGRYGNLMTWELQNAMEIMVSGPINLASEREAVWKLLS